MSDLTDFEAIVAVQPELVMTPLQAMFAEADEELRAERPEGFEVHEIVERAFFHLPVAEHEAARRELGTVYWEARIADEQMLAHAAELQAQRRELRRLFGRYEDLAESGAPVPYELLLSIVKLALPLTGSAS
ncbi:hypothetical protein [Streptomyces sp.]|uniref:hypothetical protein n=1 Tax=Streptomyces sp. TaxID=1931 RepID=UPI002811CC26|nr:hypothetical protein [Streptomyces sp.]